ncbi:MAG: hypothetical protein BWY31_03235 [Lentisphaerae bacterium ADurb.Bin242]|nr:MAG: hypothetical protein BWY31_03235 [Lentisphaerae bacterium ADurb.Bin242]
MKKIFLSFLLSGGLLLLSASGDELVANTALKPYFDPPGKLMGRDLWNNVPVTGRFEKELREIAKEPMTQCSYGTIPYIGSSLFDGEPPENTRLMMREIEIFAPDSKKNIAPEAKVTAWAKDASIRFPERVNDGDDHPRSTSYSAPARIRENQEGWFALSFAKPEKIGKVVVKSGRKRSEEKSDFIHLATNFSFQSLQKDGSWKDIPGTHVTQNTDAVRTVVFPAVETAGIRIHVFGQGTTFRVNTSRFSKFTPEKDRPFLIPCTASRPPFHCFEEVTCDRPAYEKWKQENPGFLGFYVAEWDNDFQNLIWKRQKLDEYCKQLNISPLVRDRIRDLLSKADTRQGMLEALKAYHSTIRKHFFDDPKKLVFIDCCRALSHYALEWGCADYYFIETTCAGYQRHQVQMYFIRGAARQYGIPWGWYIAVGMWGKTGYNDPDYIGKWSVGNAGGKGGISQSLNLRDRYLAWFAGATSVFNEVWPYAYCEDKNKDGVWGLSPHGEAMKDWYAFTRKYPDRGVSYAPVALGLQYDHMTSPINGCKIFGILPQERGDLMSEALLRTIVPYKFGLGDQEWALSETPYGDIYDVILPNPPSGPVKMDVLKNYRVLFLSGQFNPDKAFAGRLMEYVRNGGTLAINTKQLGSFLPASFTGVTLSGTPADTQGDMFTPSGEKVFTVDKLHSFDPVTLAGASPFLVDGRKNVMMAFHRYGKGNVIVTTVDHLIQKDTGNPDANTYSKWGRNLKFPFMDYLLGKIVKEVLPLEVEGKVEYGLNVLKDGGLLLYLINNNGVKKTSTTAQELDPSQAVKAKVLLRKLKPGAVTELRTEKRLAVGPDNTVEIVVPPGDLRVLKIQ